MTDSIQQNEKIENERTEEVLETSESRDEGLNETDAIKESLRVIYKFNSFVEKKVKGFRDFFYTPIGRIVVLFFIFAFFAVPLVMIVLGFDNYIFRSTIDGKVFSLNNESVRGAQVSIQGKTTRTDAQGNFRFDDLDYGKWEIVIRAEGFNEYREQIVLNRLSNSQNFELVPLDFGVSKGALTASDLKIDGIILKINDQEIEINEDGSFETGRLIVGKYKLKFESVNYIDFEKEIEIRNGTNLIEPITLIPAGDLEGEVKNFISGEILDGYDLKIEGTESKPETLDKKFKIKDIKSPSKIKINIKKDGYKERELELLINQGIENSISVDLVKDEKIVYHLNGNIIVSDIDGENQVILTEGLSGCEFEKEFAQSVLVRCAGNLYSSNKVNGEYTPVTQSGESIDGFISSGIIDVNNFTEEKIQYLPYSDEGIVLFNSDETVLSWVFSESESILFFSTNEGIYKKYINDDSEPTLITTGIFYLQETDDGGRRILAQNYTTLDKSINNLWFISFDGEKTRITFAPELFSDPQILDSNNIIYRKFDGAKNNLYIKNLSNTNEKMWVQEIDKYVINRGASLVTTGIGPILYVGDFNGNFKKVI